ASLTAFSIPGERPYNIYADRPTSRAWGMTHGGECIPYDLQESPSDPVTVSSQGVTSPNAVSTRLIRADDIRSNTGWLSLGRAVTIRGINAFDTNAQRDQRLPWAPNGTHCTVGSVEYD